MNVCSHKNIAMSVLNTYISEIIEATAMKFAENMYYCCSHLATPLSAH